VRQVPVLTIEFDASYREQNSMGSYGFILRWGNEEWHQGGTLGHVKDNNIAEFEALRTALEYVALFRLKPTYLLIKGDSQYVIDRMHIRRMKLAQRCWELIEGMCEESDLLKVPRRRNAAADRMTKFYATRYHGDKPWLTTTFT